MLRSLDGLLGYRISAEDGDLGRAQDFLFDDSSWTVRYLVVETGSWLNSRRVLISPAAIGQPDWSRQVLPVSLTREQVRNSPELDADKPVSRQKEIEVSVHYGWPAYWSGQTVPMPIPNPDVEAALAQTEASGDPHLRSAREVIGYRIHATDGQIGHVHDFIVDDGIWLVRYVTIATGEWLPGKKVLIAPQWIEAVSWALKEVKVGLPRKTIQGCPEYDPAAPVNREYEVRLYDYYGRPKYWE